MIMAIDGNVIINALISMYPAKQLKADILSFTSEAALVTKRSMSAGSISLNLAVG